MSTLLADILDGGGTDPLDSDDPEFRKRMMRPADVKEDVALMEQHKRVLNVLGHEMFKNDLDSITKDSPASLLALKQMLTPQSRANFSGRAAASAPVMPINDLRGPEAGAYSKGERVIRCKLAACYRLVDLSGWSQGIVNHITYRTQSDEVFVNPFGLLYNEITASSLVKINLQGEVLDSGSTHLGINKAGFLLHSAIHAARPDIRCIIHLHVPSVVAVSSLKCGLLPLSQESLIVGSVSYHNYWGIIVNEAEKDAIAADLGPSNHVMFLRNHGVVACGETIEEAFHFLTNVIQACDAQLQAMSSGVRVEDLNLPSEEARQKAYETARIGGGGVDVSSGGGQARRQFRVGELEFASWMRQMDRAGFRTGYLYPQPLVTAAGGSSTHRPGGLDRKLSNDVEIPPALTSTGTGSPDDFVFDLGSPYKYMMKAQKTEWLFHTPNSYSKKVLQETGTVNPKKIVKWEAEDSPAKHSNTVVVTNPNQFAPQGADPKEFKLTHKTVKKEYYEDKIHAGPQSKILEGMTWSEAEQRTRDPAAVGPGGDATIVVGAASKGIIQRDFQHNVQTYKQEYSSNPFANMQEEDLETYQREIEEKKRQQEQGQEGEGPTDSSPHAENAQFDTVHAANVQKESYVNGQPESRDGGGATSPRGGGGGGRGDETLRSTDEETGEDESPAKGKRQKKKFKMPSFGKGKSKQK